ncbi:MAG TPA: hypothetical protein P5081_18795 [Phycisphaerae bacterium]|nr:hypothetical protein [Phycisphaerae bacterium]HRW54921.1 hypothetical protein [Phycisphaerae bacterium]
MTRSTFAPAKRLTAAILLCALAGVTPGCGPRTSGTNTVLPARPRSYVVDVPVPADFELDRRKSTHENRPGERAVKHYYVGDEKPQPVNDFYKQLMPTFDWEFVDERLQNGVYVLNYEKAGEKCEVRVDQMPGGFWGPKTRVSVVIAAKD